MEYIPNEILYEFIKYCNPADKCALLFVSKIFALLLGKQDGSLQKITKCGSVAQFLWIKKMQGQKYDRSTICKEVAEAGNLEILKYMRNCKKCRWNDKYACRNAAYNGHLEILKYARERGHEFDIYSCRDAAHNNHLHILQYCYDEGLKWDGYETFKDKNGNGIKIR